MRPAPAILVWLAVVLTPGCSQLAYVARLKSVSFSTSYNTDTGKFGPAVNVAVTVEPGKAFDP